MPQFTTSLESIQKFPNESEYDWELWTVSGKRGRAKK
jgi:hypothetical protein